MRLRKINNGLVVLIVLINTYIALAPVWPQIGFWLAKGDDERHAAFTTKVSKDTVANPVPADNRLVIPAMLLDQPIVEGPVSQTYANLDKGIWRWPNGSSPDKGGNTILLGHRFTYQIPKGPLYFLDKVAIGDKIAVNWQGKRHIYKVAEIKTVSPSETDILENTNDSRLTIYTCTPLWNPTSRLVVIAKEEV